MDRSLFTANAIPITPSNLLRLAFWNASNQTGYTVQVRYQIENKDGSISQNLQTIVVGAAAANSQTLIPLAYGNLLAVTMSTFGTTLQNGTLYGIASLQYGSVNDNTQQLPLISGYVLANAPLSYPLGQVRSVNSGVMNPTVIAPNDPGPGNELSYSNSVTAQAILVAGSLLFTTNATVASRIVNIAIGDQNGTVYSSRVTTAQTAGKSFRLCFWTTPLPLTPPAFTDYIPILLTEPLRGLTLNTTTENIQNGDEFTEIRLHFNEYAVI